ncbi:hypothetical protein Tco_0132959 [Tanacetum coccineum]
MGSLLNTSEIIFLTFDGVYHQTFRAARFDVLRTAESDSDDEEEYVIKINKFRAPIYGPRPAPYLNYANPEDQSSAIQAITNPFKKISVWKKAVSFLGSLPVPLKQVNSKPNYKGSYTKEEEATGQLQEHTTEKPDRHDPNAQEMKPWKSYCFHKFTTSFYYRKDVPEMLSLGGSDEIMDKGGWSKSTSKWICECSLDDCKMDEEKRYGLRKRGQICMEQWVLTRGCGRSLSGSNIL